MRQLRTSCNRPRMSPRGVQPDRRPTFSTRMPDHPAILKNYIWQQYDLHPDFLELKIFLDFWTRELDGLLHSVTIVHARLITPAEF